MTRAAKRTIDWPGLKSLALGLNLPHVVEATSWGQPCLKAHGKLWVWWSPHENAPVFKVSLESRALMLEMEPERFFVTPHYQAHALVLMRPTAFDAAWAKANLVQVWKQMAPKKVLKAWQAAQDG